MLLITVIVEGSITFLKSMQKYQLNDACGGAEQISILIC